MTITQSIEGFYRSIDSRDECWFRDVALRGHILRYEWPDDDGDERWTVTPFNEEGEPCGEPLVLWDDSFEDDDVEGWIERTPVIYTEAELPERIKQLDVYGRTSDEERTADKLKHEKAMLEFERELLLCNAPQDVMH